MMCITVTHIQYHNQPVHELLTEQILKPCLSHVQSLVATLNFVLKLSITSTVVVYICTCGILFPLKSSHTHTHTIEHHPLN